MAWLPLTPSCGRMVNCFAMDLDIASSSAIPGLVIRTAQDNEARACRMLLPEMFTAFQAPDVLVATVADPARNGTSRIVGGAGVGTTLGPKRSLPTLVHVVPSWRRRGVGRNLIEAVAARSCGRADTICPPRPVPAASQAALFLMACGFDQWDRIIHFEVDGLPFYADVLRVRRRLEQHGRIPPEMRILRLRDADPDAVTDLVCRCIETSHQHVRARFNSRADDVYDLENSVVLMMRDVVAGVLIYTWNGGIPMIEVRAVDPALRGGWANAVMLEEATRNAKEAGALRFRFFASDKLNDTMSLARRANAEQIKVELQFGRGLAG